VLCNRVSIVRFALPSLLILAIAVGANPARSQEYNWNGFSVYAGIGVSKIDADVSISDETTYSVDRTCTPVEKPSNRQGLCLPFGQVAATASNLISGISDGNGGILGTVGVAADFEFSPGFVIGAFADFDKSNNASTDFSGSLTNPLGRLGLVNATTSVAGKLEQDYSFSVGGRLGLIAPNRQGLVYLLAAYTQVHMDSSSATINNSIMGPFGGTASADPISASMPTKFNGLTLGMGGELKLSSAWL
jgi:hypothetical protein